MSDYYSTALSYGFGQSLYGLNVDGKKRMTQLLITKFIMFPVVVFKPKVMVVRMGSNGNFKPDQTYTYFGGTNSSNEREIIIKPQDLRNIEKVESLFPGGNNMVVLSQRILTTPTSEPQSISAKTS